MKHTTLGPLAAGLAALLLLVAACGNDDETTQIHSSSVEDDEPDTATEQQEGGPNAEPPAAETDGPAEEDLPALLLIMDASGSMNATGTGGQPLMDEAQQALVDVVEQLPEGQHVGLRVYGHTYPNTDRENGCRDTELIHPVEPLNRPAMIDSINSFEARGFTPIGLSLEQGARDLPPEGPRTMILVSDGEETCDTDPCAVAEQIRDDGIELVIHTVGFALGDNDQAREELGCIAEAGGGRYVEVDEAGELAETLEDMSVRDQRELELTGDVLEGAPAPSRAPTGRPGVVYTDTVRGDETNYYRFEVPPGSEVGAEVIVLGHPTATRQGSPAFCPAPRLTDAGTALLRRSSDLGGGGPEQTYTRVMEPVEVEAGEVFIELETNACSTAAFGEYEFDVEIQVTVVG